jgi:subtilase family serine protease
MLNFISIRRRTMMVLFTANICGLSLLAEPPTRPPEGFARPPFHLKLDDSLLPLVTPGPTGLSPAAVRHFYGFDLITNLGAGQVIGIVTAYDDPNVEADLGVFNSNFKLATCTTSNGCFKKIYATGVKPATDATWALEAALDVQWAHAIAPQAKIYLVEAASNSVTDLLAGVDVAVKNGATVVSMSFGGAEFLTETNNDFHFTTAKVTFVAAAGDSGYGVEYPAASSYVLAVGGTTATLGTSNTYGSETAWSGSGGGRSTYELMASYQSGLPVPNANGYRAIPDVAYDANPSSGFAMYDSVAYQGSTGWFQVGGTSAGTPQWAALAAIVNSMRVAAKKQVLGATTTSTINNLLYLLGQPASYPNDYHDIKSGTNGTCGTICTSVAGYDYVTGLGSPKANALINALVAQP